MERDPLVEALVDGFAAEARDIAQRITGNILELENSSSGDEPTRRRHFDDLARGLHTLKGNADTFGFSDLTQLAHRMEDLVAKFRPSLAAFPSETTDLLLRSIDMLMARIAARAHDPDPALAALIAELGGLHVAHAPVPSPVGTDDSGAASSPPPATPPPPLPPSASPTPSGSLAGADPAETVLEDWRVGPRHVESLLREIERLRELRLRLDDQKREIERNLGRLEHAHELDVAETRAIMITLSRGLGADGEEANDIVDGLEQELKAIATLPLHSVLDPLHRAVRQLCRNLNKEARLAVLGAEISLDRRLLEALKGPIVHLVRNAIDHGIETPDVRIAAGKHREGAITIRVERSGNLVFIDIEDDGAGIDPVKIRAAAVARDLVSPEEAAAMTESELHQLLFSPGFSTRSTITETSGRGVGLDVVRAAVQAFSGHLEIHTSVGSGTRFLLTLPAALGSTPVLVVRIDEQMLGIPLVAIETIRAAKPEHIHAGRTSARFEHDGHLLPLIDLGAVLSVRAQGAAKPGQPVLVIAARGAKIGLMVDELIGDRELVVRPLPIELHDLTAYQGAAIQARGDLLLVVQPEFLVEGRATSADVESVRRALVVDDSLTARALHRTILESGGYQVHAVASARQALDHLRHAAYDVVIADVMMPDIDGLQLAAMLRSRRETRDLPLILVSAHDTQPERERGLAAGADAFLSKKDCISGRLLSEVAAATSKGRSR